MSAATPHLTVPLALVISVGIPRSQASVSNEGADDDEGDEEDKEDGSDYDDGVDEVRRIRGAGATGES